MTVGAADDGGGGLPQRRKWREAAGVAADGDSGSSRQRWRERLTEAAAKGNVTMVHKDDAWMDTDFMSRAHPRRNDESVNT